MSTSHSGDVVRLRMAWVRGGVFLDVRGSAMDVHQAGQSWVQTAAAHDPERSDIYERFATAIGRFVDEPAPDSGLRAVINKPLGVMWVTAWPWAPAGSFNSDEGWQWAPGLDG